MVDWLLAQLPAWGPPFLFALATLETCFVTGLVVPSGVATSLATVLALQGSVELVPMLIAAFAGGALEKLAACHTSATTPNGARSACSTRRRSSRRRRVTIAARPGTAPSRAGRGGSRCSCSRRGRC